MKRGENIEYDNLTKELFNIRVQLKTKINTLEEKEELLKREKEILNEIKKIISNNLVEGRKIK